MNQIFKLLTDARIPFSVTYVANVYVLDFNPNLFDVVDYSNFCKLVALVPNLVVTDV
jgi:hypothetical protein